MFFLQSKNKVAAIALICCGALQSGSTFAVAPPKTTATAVVSGGVINFGAFAVPASCAGCTITIAAGGGRSVTGGIILSVSNGGSPATFQVTQSCSAGGCTSYSVLSITANSALTAGGVSMTLGTFTSAQSTVVNKVNTLSVGATLTIPSKPATAGTFAGGGFTVTTTP